MMEFIGYFFLKGDNMKFFDDIEKLFNEVINILFNLEY